MISIALNNSLRSLWPLLLGLVEAQRLRLTRLLADGLVLANLLVAGLLVGSAIGGYGMRVLVFLPHVPLEWAGIALGRAGWIVEREQGFRKRKHAFIMGLIASVLLCAAIVETWLVPHR